MFHTYLGMLDKYFFLFLSIDKTTATTIGTSTVISTTTTTTTVVPTTTGMTAMLISSAESSALTNRKTGNFKIKLYLLQFHCASSFSQKVNQWVIMVCARNVGVFFRNVP